MGLGPALSAQAHLAHDDVGAAEPLLADAVDDAHLVRRRVWLMPRLGHRGRAGCR